MWKERRYLGGMVQDLCKMKRLMAHERRQGGGWLVKGHCGMLKGRRQGVVRQGYGIVRLGLIGGNLIRNGGGGIGLMRKQWEVGQCEGGGVRFNYNSLRRYR